MSALEKIRALSPEEGWGSPGVQIGPPLYLLAGGQGPPSLLRPGQSERSQIGHFGCPRRVRQQVCIGPLGTWFNPMLSSHCDYDLGPQWASVFLSENGAVQDPTVTSEVDGALGSFSCSGFVAES